MIVAIDMEGEWGDNMCGEKVEKSEKVWDEKCGFCVERISRVL